MRANLPRVVVIGGGGTGIATLYDLARRGFDAVLLERGELTSGTTGRHHGQLHCGARYAVSDSRIGAECYAESKILCDIALPSIEYNYGIFAALDEQDMAYLPMFLEGCGNAGIPVRVLATGDAMAMEPGLSEEICAAVLVPDGTIDAYRLAMQFAASAVGAGGDIRRFHGATGIDVRAGRVAGVEYVDRITGKNGSIDCDVVINATGVWGSQTAALAGATLDVTPSPGTMVAFTGRHVHMVISRLHPPGDGDIVVPQRLLSIAGSTQRIAGSSDDTHVSADDVELLRQAGSRLVPSLGDAPISASWTASRPLAGGAGSGSGVRSLSRDFLCVDHAASDGVAGLYSIIGGKATVLRRMAQEIVDKVCRADGIRIECTTADTHLCDYRSFFAPGKECS